MGKKISVSQLFAAVMEAVQEYADTAVEEVKHAVMETGNEVRDEIRQNAPKNTGAYARSWAVKKTRETSQSLTVTVHSRNHYQLAHLLEFGHAKRGGDRVAAQPHIAQAEEHGIEQLEEKLRKAVVSNEL